MCHVPQSKRHTRNSVQLGGSRSWHVPSHPDMPSLVHVPQVISSMNNIILGKLYVDHAGVMEVKSLHTAQILLLTFKQGGRTFTKNYHRVRLYAWMWLLTALLLGGEDA